MQLWCQLGLKETNSMPGRDVSSELEEEKENWEEHLYFSGVPSLKMGGH